MIKTIIIDDESDSIETLETLIKENCQDIQIVGTSYTVESGINNILKQNPDLLFLDVELESETGFDLIKKIPTRNFEVIFITAHNHYAIKAFKYSAVDYLLKPIDVDDLIAAVEKVTNKISGIKNSNENYTTLLSNLSVKEPVKIALPSFTGMEYININNILYIQADGRYSKIHLDDRTLLVSRNLGELEDILPKTIFARIHNSYLVNLHYVNRFNRKDSKVVITNNDYLPLSRTNKDAFLDAMKRIAK